MKIEFEDPNSHYWDMLDEWNKLEDASLEPVFMSHYDLASRTKFSANDWKDFLTNPQVADEINREMLLIQQAKRAKLIQGIDSETRSTGTAQLINTLTSNIEKGKESKDTGPAFIYTFVPLSEDQAQADNVRVLDHNPFLRGDRNRD